MNNGKNGQGTHCAKMVADSSAENTPNAPEFICTSPNVLDCNEKRLHGASIVRERNHLKLKQKKRENATLFPLNLQKSCHQLNMLNVVQDSGFGRTVIKTKTMP